MLLSNSVYTLVIAALIGCAVAIDRTECYTVMTSRRPRNVPTQYTTEYTACTKTLYSTTTVTTTPKPTAVTQVYYSYATVYDDYKGISTTTKTSTVSTSTVTTTISTSTTTSTITALAQSVVPAPAMFTPIQDSLPGSSFTNTSLAAAPKKLGKRDYSSNKYPKMVLCHIYTANKYCAEKRVTTTKTVTAKKSTVTVKITKKLTSTVCPDAKRTVTTTKTTTTTSTSISTSVVPKTITSASIVGTTTIYEVCLSTRNYANAVSATPIIDIDPIPADREPPLEAVTVVENAFQCCNAALGARGNLGDLITSPQIFVFDSQRRRRRVGDGTDDTPQDTGGICSIFGASTCSGQQADNQYGVELDDEPPEEGVEPRRITVGNAPCGDGVPAQTPEPQP